MRPQTFTITDAKGFGAGILFGLFLVVVSIINPAHEPRHRSVPASSTTTTTLEATK